MNTLSHQIKQIYLVAHVVTHNHMHTIRHCLDSLLQQKFNDSGFKFEIWVTDNDSSDETRNILSDEFSNTCRIHHNTKNLGFSEAHNQCISEAIAQGADFVFIANPDLRLRTSALCALCQSLINDPSAGTACPKLFRADGYLKALQPHILDATGMFITPCIRHFDRGSQEPDRGYYDSPEYVFGGSGAALLISRACAIDVSLRASDSITEQKYLEVFDEQFFAYREDADLAWRSQWLGWKCRYVPNAVGFHQRRVLPEYRAYLPAELNALGVRNRFLLQLNNWSLLSNAHCLLAQTWRNLLVIVAAFTIEPTSKPALMDAWKRRSLAIKHRTNTLSKKRASAISVSKWFQKNPMALPALEASHASPIQSLQIIIVNFNSGDRLKACIDSIKQSASKLVTQSNFVTVIDNASSDTTSLDEIASSAHESDLIPIQLISSRTNLGFAGAINKAAKEHLADAILVLNPDVEVTAAALNTLVEKLDSYAMLGAVAPCICDHSSLVQRRYCARKFPTLGNVISELWFLHRLWPNNPWTSFYEYKDDPIFEAYITHVAPQPNRPYVPSDSPYIVPQVAGACMLIRGSAFRKIGGFNESFWPAWFEDVDFCKRLHDNKYSCALVSSASVYHEGGYCKNTITPATFAQAWYQNLARYWFLHSSKRDYIIFRVNYFCALVLRGLIALCISATTLMRNKDQSARKLSLSLTLIKQAFTGCGIRQRRTTFMRSQHSLLSRITSRILASVVHIKQAWNILNDDQYKITDKEPKAPELPIAHLPKDTLPIAVVSDHFSWCAHRLVGHGLFVQSNHNSSSWHMFNSPQHYQSQIMSSESQLDTIICNATCKELKSIETNSYDFLIVPTHLHSCLNPLQLLLECSRIVRAGRCILCSTLLESPTGVHSPVELHITQFLRPSSERLDQILLKHVLKTHNLSGQEALQRIKNIEPDSYAAIIHEYSMDDIAQLVEWISLNIPRIRSTGTEITELRLERGTVKPLNMPILQYLLTKT